MGKRKPGRPTVMTPAVIQELERNLELILPIKTACALSGCGESTFHRWMERAIEPDAPKKYVEFRERMERAKERGHRNLVAGILAAHQGGKWEAGRWLLKCRYPEVYGDTPDTVVEVRKPVSDEELIAWMESKLGVAED